MLKDDLGMAKKAKTLERYWISLIPEKIMP